MDAIGAGQFQFAITSMKMILLSHNARDWYAYQIPNLDLEEIDGGGSGSGIDVATESNYYCEESVFHRNNDKTWSLFGWGNFLIKTDATTDLPEMVSVQRNFPEGQFSYKYGCDDGKGATWMCPQDGGEYYFVMEADGTHTIFNPETDGTFGYDFIGQDVLWDEAHQCYITWFAGSSVAGNVVFFARSDDPRTQPWVLANADGVNVGWMPQNGDFQYLQISSWTGFKMRRAQNGKYVIFADNVDVTGMDLLVTRDSYQATEKAFAVFADPFTTNQKEFYWTTALESGCNIDTFVVLPDRVVLAGRRYDPSELEIYHYTAPFEQGVNPHYSVRIVGIGSLYPSSLFTCHSDSSILYLTNGNGYTEYNHVSMMADMVEAGIGHSGGIYAVSYDKGETWEHTLLADGGGNSRTFITDNGDGTWSSNGLACTGMGCTPGRIIGTAGSTKMAKKRFVALASYEMAGGIIWSDDGRTWTDANLPFAGMVRYLIYYKEAYVAVVWRSQGGGETSVVRSVDGITWTSVAVLPEREPTDWIGEIIGAWGAIMIVGNYKTATSLDGGLTWTINNQMPLGNEIGAHPPIAVYGGGYMGSIIQLIATDGSGQAVWTNGLGIPGTYSGWRGVEMLADAAWLYSAAVKGGDAIVVIPKNSDVAYWSRQFSAGFFPMYMPSSSGWKYLMYGRGVFVAIAESGTDAAMVSLTYIYNIGETTPTWLSATLPVSCNWHSCLYGGGRFVLLGADGAGVSHALWSEDGQTWTEGTIESSVQVWTSIEYANGVFVAISTNGKVAWSKNGEVWAMAAIPSNKEWTALTSGSVMEPLDVDFSKYVAGWGVSVGGGGGL